MDSILDETKHKNEVVPLKTLVLGCFIGKGEIDFFSGKPEVIVNFHPSKANFLRDFIQVNRLEEYTTMDYINFEMTIKSHEILNEYYELWYKDGKKMFNPTTVDYESIILSLILFGKRRLEYLALETTIEREYIRTLAITLAHYLKIQIVPGVNNVKIHDTVTLIITALKRLGLNQTTELVQFLTNSEKRKIQQSVNQLGRR